jgi:hypothetical protein
MAEPPPKAIVTDLRVAHLTKAVARRGEIHFELHVPDNDDATDLAASLAFKLLDMPFVPAREGPISVDAAKDDRSKVTIVYKPHGKRNLGEDMRTLTALLGDSEIPITDTVREGIGQAFDALRQLNAPGHASAEAARRSAKKGPRGRGMP